MISGGKDSMNARRRSGDQLATMRFRDNPMIQRYHRGYGKMSDVPCTVSGMSETPPADPAGRFAGVRPANATTTPPQPTGHLCRKCGALIRNTHDEKGMTWDGVS